MPVKKKVNHDPLTLKLVRVRQALGWSQERMCKEFGVSRPTLSTWECYGPPPRGPARKWVAVTLERLRKRAYAANREKEQTTA